MFLAPTMGMATHNQTTQYRSQPSAWQWMKAWWRARSVRAEVSALDRRADAVARMSADAMGRMVAPRASKPTLVRRQTEL